MKPARVTTVASSVVALAAVPVFLTGAMGVQIRAEFGLGPAGFGIMLSAFHLSSTLASPALGRAVERHPASMRWAVTLTLVSLVGIALGGRSPVLYAGFLIGTGLGFALAQTSTNLFITRTVPAGNRATVLGIKHAAIPLAALLAGLAVPTVAVTIGWRWAFAIAAGGVTLLLAWLPKSFTGFRNPPAKDGGGSPPKELIVLVLATILAMASGSALSAFLVSYAVSTGIGAASAGFLLSAGGASAVAMRVMWGWLADRRSTRGFFGIVGLLTVGSVGYLLLSTEQPALILVGAMTSFAGVLGWSGLLVHAVVDRNLKAPARATGVTQVGFYAGGGIGPPLFGFLIDQFSYRFAWMTAAGLVLVAAGLVLAVELSSRAKRT
ncbi:MAG: MFS transporter [bacterium]|nr:MFS transporter [bacterium]